MARLRVEMTATMQLKSLSIQSTTPTAREAYGFSDETGGVLADYQGSAALAMVADIALHDQLGF
jgi:hypothetical protein